MVEAERDEMRADQPAGRQAADVEADEQQPEIEGAAGPDQGRRRELRRVLGHGRGRGRHARLAQAIGAGVVGVIAHENSDHGNDRQTRGRDGEADDAPAMGFDDRGEQRQEDRLLLYSPSSVTIH